MTFETDFLNKVEVLSEMIIEKNKQYGGSYQKSAEILKVLYPDGIFAQDYKNLLAVVRIIDKLFRIANRGNDNEWDDIAGYSLLMAVGHYE